MLFPYNAVPRAPMLPPLTTVLVGNPLLFALGGLLTKPLSKLTYDYPHRTQIVSGFRFAASCLCSLLIKI
jgi:hypothetical protein